MFPARAGMSLAESIARTLKYNVPRASGDEPHATRRILTVS